jgi:tRNA pseudouridine55 synthase
MIGGPPWTGLETPDLEHDIEVMSFSCESRRGEAVSFAAEVSSGTYIRALASDLGETLGCGAHLAELRRTRVGALPVDEAIEPGDVTLDAVRPPRHALSHLTGIEVTDQERIAVSHGRSIEREPAENEGPVALLAGPDLVAVAERAGRELVPKVVLTG